MLKSNIVGTMGRKEKWTGQKQSSKRWNEIDCTHSSKCWPIPSSVMDNGRMDRIEMLSEILGNDPSNAFARYGLAMEYSNAGELDRALEEFGKLLSANPDYTAGYFMAAQTLVKAGRADEAKQMLGDGMASAQRKGDGHALSEMEALLQEISA
jgi:predicted Zn-dependent protease